MSVVAPFPGGVIRPDWGEAGRALDLLIPDGQVCEIRALDVSTHNFRREHVESGFFTDRTSPRAPAAA